MAPTAMSAAPGRFDALLTSLAQQHGSVESLLDSFFDFLHRKTDFYVVARDPAARGMGFQPGQAQQKLLRAFHKFPIKDLDAMDGAAQVAVAASSSSPSSSSRPAAAAIGGRETAAGASVSVQAPHVPSSGPSQGQAPASPATTATVLPSVHLTEEGKQVPVGNGGATDAYSWTQTLADVSVQVELPPGTKAKDVDCKITATRLRVVLRPTGGAGAKVLLDGELADKVRVDESLWSLESQKTLLISLEKARETWWASVVKGDPEIDTTQVDSTRRIDEYDEGTQGAIRKIVYEQRQRQQGEAAAGGGLTAEERLLEQARQLPGSPLT